MRAAGQLGRRIEQARDDERQRQIATALRCPSWQQGVEPDAPRSTARSCSSRSAGEVGEGPVLGLATLPVALAQQDGRRRASIGNDRDIHARIESNAFAPYQAKSLTSHDCSLEAN